MWIFFIKKAANKTFESELTVTTEKKTKIYIPHLVFSIRLLFVCLSLFFNDVPLVGYLKELKFHCYWQLPSTRFIEINHTRGREKDRSLEYSRFFSEGKSLSSSFSLSCVPWSNCPCGYPLGYPLGYLQNYGCPCRIVRTITDIHRKLRALIFVTPISKQIFVRISVLRR